MRAPSYLPLPHLPTLLAGEHRHRFLSGHLLVVDQVERGLEQRAQSWLRDAERRAALVVVEEEEPGEQAAGPHHFRHARAPLRPAAARQGTEERALIHEIERRLVQREEVRQPYGQRELARAPERRLRKINTEHVVAVIGEVLHFITRAAARDEHAPSPRLFL